MITCNEIYSSTCLPRYFGHVGYLAFLFEAYIRRQMHGPVQDEEMVDIS